MNRTSHPIDHLRTRHVIPSWLLIVALMALVVFAAWIVTVPLHSGFKTPQPAATVSVPHEAPCNGTVTGQGICTSADEAAQADAQVAAMAAAQAAAQAKAAADAAAAQAKAAADAAAAQQAADAAAAQQQAAQQRTTQRAPAAQPAPPASNRDTSTQGPPGNICEVDADGTQIPCQG